MELIRPTKKYKNSFLEYIEEIKRKDELKKIGDAAIKENENFEQMLMRIEKIRYKENLIGAMKPTSVFGMVDNNKVVGTMNVREELNEFTYYTVGNIGYYVMPAFRNKGYATSALSFAKKYCKSIGLNKILLICSSDNPISEKVIRKNGGVFETEIKAFNENYYLKRYWISL